METILTHSDASAPGAMLRQARTERGMSIDEAAQALRLSPRVLSALEEEAYDRLPGPTYVRGYLRSYAQFLGLSPGPLIETFNNRPEANRRTNMTGPSAARQVTSSDAMVRLASVAVAVIILGLAVMWWTGHEGSIRLRSEPAAVEPAVERAPAPERVPDAPDPLSDPPEVAAPVPAPAPEREPIEETPPAAPAPETPAPENVSPADPAPESPAPESADARTPVPETALSPRAAPAPDPGAPLARLVLYAHEDCWADVRDANGERLLYETIPAGRVVTVEGAAPLQVFLGNVAGVTVEFNGEEYDASRHQRGRMARFTLGSSGG